MTTKETQEEVAPLGLILDIDGTVIAEGRHITSIILRPGVVEFLKKRKQKGYALAIWTAGHWTWAHTVSTKLCRLIHQDNHNCSHHCKRTFDFIWHGEKLRRRTKIPQTNNWGDEFCRWCGPYKHRCDRCVCWQYAFACPCMYTKDLRKVWYADEEATETQNFVKHRTLIIENTPQQCIHNYGNAIYVPTFSSPELEKEKRIFQKLGDYLEKELEDASSVREVQKCVHGSQPHACYEQIWWTQE